MEKVSLPIKTKIAAWLNILLIGPSTILNSFFVGFGGIAAQSPEGFFYGALMTVLGLLFLFFNLFLLSRKKIGYWLVGISLLIFLIWYVSILRPFNKEYVSESYLSIDGKKIRIDIIPYVLPLSLILLLFDRKNFWKIAT